MIVIASPMASSFCVLSTFGELSALSNNRPNTDTALREKNAAQWKVVFEEDIFVVEGMQKGRNAPGFDGGRFSPAMDGPTHCFHDWVASQVANHLDAS